MRLTTFRYIQVLTHNGIEYPMVQPGVFEVPTELGDRLIDAFPHKFWKEEEA